MREFPVLLCAILLASPIPTLGEAIPGSGGAGGVETDPVYAGQKGAANGAATLDASSKLTSSQLPAITSSTLTFGSWVGGSTTFSGLPAAGVVAKDGDWAVLHVDDGANPAGLYELASSVWTLRAAITEGDVDAGPTVPGSCTSRQLFVENDVAPPVLYACAAGSFSQVGGGGSGSDVSIGGAFLSAVDLRSEGTVDLTICTGAGAPDPRCQASSDVLFDHDGWDAFVDLSSATPCADATLALEAYNEGADRTPNIFFYQSNPATVLDQGDFLPTSTSAGAGSFMACIQEMPTTAHVGGVPVADGTSIRADLNSAPESGGRLHFHNVDLTIDCQAVAQTSDLVFHMRGGSYLNGRLSGTAFAAGGEFYNAAAMTGSLTLRTTGDCDGGVADGVVPFLDPTGANLYSGTAIVAQFVNGAHRSETSGLIRRFFDGSQSQNAFTGDRDNVGILHQWTWGHQYGATHIRGLGGIGLHVVGSASSLMRNAYITQNQGVGIQMGDIRGGGKVYATANCPAGADCGVSTINWPTTNFVLSDFWSEGNKHGNLVLYSGRNLVFDNPYIETATTTAAHSVMLGGGWCTAGDRAGQSCLQPEDCYTGGVGTGTCQAPTASAGQAYDVRIGLIKGGQIVGTNQGTCSGSCTAPNMVNPDSIAIGPHAEIGSQWRQEFVIDGTVVNGSTDGTNQTLIRNAGGVLAGIVLRLDNIQPFNLTAKLGYDGRIESGNAAITHPTDCTDAYIHLGAGGLDYWVLPGTTCHELDSDTRWVMRSDDGDVADEPSDWQRIDEQIVPISFAVQDGATYAGGICQKTQDAFTITEVSTYVGSAGTSPTTNVEIRTVPNGTPTNVLASPLAMDVDGEFTTTISQAAVAAGEFLCWPALGGTPAAAAAVVTVHGVR